MISIHAPRERSDLLFKSHAYALGEISIHAPRERSDSHTVFWNYDSNNFNPRSS